MSHCNQFISLSDNVINTFKFYVDLTRQNNLEYGGILLGSVSVDGLIDIQVATVPDVNDCSGNNYFIREKNNAQRLVDDWWHQSTGLVNYLGEWHTHPFYDNRPSCTDLLLLKQAFEINSGLIGLAVMIIVDISNQYRVIVVDQSKRQYSKVDDL